MPENRPTTPGVSTPAAPVSPPAHHRLELVVLVAAGGVVGTFARYATTLWLGTASSGLPTATLVVNLVGCFVLGLLLEALGRRGPETPRQQALRLGLGTGVVGGFTTFSSLAEELALLVHTHAAAVAGLYAAVSVVGGLVASVLGIVVAAGHHRLTREGLPADPDAEHPDTGNPGRTPSRPDSAPPRTVADRDNLGTDSSARRWSR